MKVINAINGFITLEITATEAGTLADLMTLAYGGTLGIDVPEELENREDLATLAQTTGSLFEMIGLVADMPAGETLQRFRLTEAKLRAMGHRRSAKATGKTVRAMKKQGGGVMRQLEIPDELAFSIAVAFLDGDAGQWRRLEAAAERIGYRDITQKVLREMGAIMKQRAEQVERALLDDLLCDVDLSGLDGEA